MHLTDHDRMETILTYRRPRNDNPSLLSKATEAHSLYPFTRIRSGDIVEDIETGTREVVRKGTFYEFLIGRCVYQAKQLPAVYDVVRRRE